MERTAAVAKVLPVIGFYLQPSVGGRVFTYNYWERVCATENVVAVKTAGFDRYLTLDVVRAATFSPRKDKIALYTGNDDNIINDLITPFSFEKDGKTYKNHFVGGLLGHWACWTGTVVKLFAELKEAVKSDKLDARWLTLAAQVTDANSAFFDTAHDFKGCIVTHGGSKLRFLHRLFDGAADAGDQKDSLSGLCFKGRGFFFCNPQHRL